MTHYTPERIAEILAMADELKSLDWRNSTDTTERLVKRGAWVNWGESPNRMDQLLDASHDLAAIVRQQAQEIAELIADNSTLMQAVKDEAAEAEELRVEAQELRKACAEIIGADVETWPDHGNAPLAIAAILALCVNEVKELRARLAAAETDAARWRILREQEAVMVSMTYDGNTGSTTWMNGDELEQWADAARNAK